MAYINGKETFFSPLQISDVDFALQATKEIEITENGSFSVEADNGFDGMVKVSVNVNVPSVKEWQTDTVYNPNEIVTYNGEYYVCIKTTQGYLDNPEYFPDEWECISGGAAYKGEYSAGESYSKGDLVVCEGNLYEAKVDNPQTPPNNDMVSHWDQLTYSVSPSGTKQITANGTYDVTEYEKVTVVVPTESSGGSYKGEYSSSTTYEAGDIVTYQGDVYLCTNDTQAGYDPINYSIYWNSGTPLNISGSGSSDGLVTLSAGTYTLSEAYNANYSLHPRTYDITESIEGSFSQNSSGGMYSVIQLEGNNGTTDGPVTTITFIDSSTNEVGRFEGYSFVSSELIVTIPNDTQVSSLFYSVFMGLIK